MIKKSQNSTNCEADYSDRIQYEYDDKAKTLNPSPKI